MHSFGVQLELEAIAEAKKKWTTAHNEFNTSVEKIMERLLHEAAANRMSVQQVAKASGYTTARVRALMKKAGLNPSNGKGLLAHSAATALVHNAELLGIEPNQINLMSPLAYLPAGPEVKYEVEHALRRAISPEMVTAFKEAWHEADANGEAGHRVEAGLAAVVGLK